MDLSLPVTDPEPPTAGEPCAEGSSFYPNFTQPWAAHPSLCAVTTWQSQTLSPHTWIGSLVAWKGCGSGTPVLLSGICWELGGLIWVPSMGPGTQKTVSKCWPPSLSLIEKIGTEPANKTLRVNFCHQHTVRFEQGTSQSCVFRLHIHTSGPRPSSLYGM